ncbi:MAG: hypothetical protein DI536_14190 [Archangium gephyra]|uniref:Uncharacterized protein n=1 Tax=Archangium gephyra TaxID=48 RepID=A0A2W5VQG1_9BACT|nr:MAG: hypothetical protein DI536_14190 [Archangium gephyra]
MGILRFVVWSSLCIGLGIFLGSAEFGGRTPWQHARGAWKQQGPRLEKVKDDAEILADEVKKKVANDSTPPKERHSEDERKAVDAIISKRSASKG